MGGIRPNHLQSLTTHLVFACKRLKFFFTNSSHEFFIKTLAVPWNSLCNRDMKFPCNSADWNFVNSWAELVDTSSKVILPISTEFQGDCFECKRVITVNPWVELGQKQLHTHNTHLFFCVSKRFGGNSKSFDEELMGSFAAILPMGSP